MNLANFPNHLNNPQDLLVVWVQPAQLSWWNLQRTYSTKMWPKKIS